MANENVFAQIMSLGHRETFQRCIERYHGDAYIKTFSCRDQWLAMAFAQLTFRDSLRDLEAALNARPELLYQMGFRSRVARSTLADANEARDWRIFADWAQTLIARARKLYAADPFGVDITQTVYALDATVIDLCLSLFPWARFRSTKAAIKLHTLLDLRGSIPSFLTLTEARVHEVNILDVLPVEAGSIYVIDRGYIDFARLARFTQQSAFFVTRAKTNMDFYVVESRPVDKASGLRCDQTIRLRGFYPKQYYPDTLRRVRFYDAELERSFVFISNLFGLTALQIAELYHARWQIELFFRWIKQHLRIRTFMGTNENAVRIQIWTALATYLLVAILKKTLKLDQSLHEIFQVISVTPFEKVPIQQLLMNDSLLIDTRTGTDDIPNLFL
ncbi:MAG: IS4 family transposase [Opitutaceae bacterium]|nr:IS4 family transposase [Opitutaceae bacterium]